LATNESPSAARSLAATSSAFCVRGSEMAISVAPCETALVEVGDARTEEPDGRHGKRLRAGVGLGQEDDPLAEADVEPAGDLLAQ
jgi:hypothetical protein